ncbi:hypothetical protein Tco_1501987 [Tanacetum coccineum]
MHEDFEYVKSLENEVDELESEKADFSNMYDLLIEECVSKDVTCSYLHSLSDLNAYAELQCLYLHKVKECECLAQKLSKQTESINNEVHNKLLKSLKAIMKTKNMVINELRNSFWYRKESHVETQFDKPSVFSTINVLTDSQKPSVFGDNQTPFLNSPEMRKVFTNQSVHKTNASDGLFKLVTQQNLPQNRNQAVRNTNVLKPGMYRIASTTTQTRTPQLPHASRILILTCLNL